MAIQTPSPLPLIINNEDVATETEFSVASPASSETLWPAYGAEPAHARAAAEAAQAAFPVWSGLKWSQRRDYLLCVADVLASRAAELHATVLRETGTTAHWEDFDVHGGIAMVRDVAGRVSSIDGRIPPTEGRAALVYRLPYGVVLGIAPWNAPVILGLRAIVYPLAAGNTVVFKGSEFTPRTHYLLVDSFREAGFPPGVVSLITHAPGNAGPPVVHELVAHPAIRKINFTGSTAVGKIIAELAGRHVKPVLLELGGKATAVVLEDADLAEAARVITDGATINAGQVCTGTERVVVLAPVAAALTAALTAEFAARFSDVTLQQPVAQLAAVDRIQTLVASSVAAGARVLYGGGQDEANPRRLQPTVFANAEATALHMTESFAPFVTLAVAADEAAAVALANDGAYGLSAAVWSRDIYRALKVAQRIETGMVHINGNTLYDESTLPYGGEQSSGMGRFGGRWGIDEFLTLKTVTFPL